ncbi:hypothetical protein CHS0354_034112 [Potamilus streckersoni]|uniref:Uncharacterized protein n=1 Tax=Potamilus streckersoni TaxID=2493646 RepID=A0AAE0TEC9_9BIVA|nr:hypothetical protein CHS0354_034112 [Potamilus streckersoni]
MASSLNTTWYFQPKASTKVGKVNPSESESKSLKEGKKIKQTAAAAETTRTSAKIATEKETQIQFDLSTNKPLFTQKTNPTNYTTQPSSKSNHRISRNTQSRENGSPNIRNYSTGINLPPATADMSRIVKNRAHPNPTR